MNHLKVCSILCFLVVANSINAQVGNDAIGTRSAAMGGCSSTFSDVWSANNNQAGLGLVKSLSTGIYYENRFLLKETGYKAGALVYPTKRGAFGLSMTSFGFELYHETKTGFSYGQRLGDYLSLGVQINYIDVGFSQEYGNKKTLTGAVGLLAKLNQSLSLGVHVYNPTRSKLAEYNDERITSVMKMGLHYRFSEKVIGIVEAEKDIHYPTILKMGVEYHPNDVLYLRGGLSTGPVLNTFGLGIKLQAFSLGIASSYHQTLGVTPSIALVYTK